MELTDRIDGLDWTALTRSLDDRGFAVTSPVLEAHNRPDDRPR